MSDTAIKIYFTRIKITSYNYKLSLSGVHQLLLEYKRQPSSGSSRYVFSLVSCTEGLKESPLPILNIVLRDRFCWDSKDSRSFQIVGCWQVKRELKVW